MFDSIRPTLVVLALLSLASACSTKTPLAQSRTAHIVAGAALPPTCIVGTLFFDTGAPAGYNIYGCTAPNVWTRETAGMVPVIPVVPPVVPPTAPPSTGGAAYGTILNSASANSGSSVTITASRSTTWTLTGPGKIIAQQGNTVTYAAPAHAVSQNSIAGCQVLPNDSIFNTPIDTLPVHTLSAIWIAQAMGVASLGVSMGESWSPNIVDNSQPVVKMSFYYSTLRNGLSYPLPYGNNRIREGGAMTTDGNNDHHMITVNRQTCHFYETYQDSMIAKTPAGQYGASSGYDYTGATYTQPVAADGGGATDAAGLPLMPLTPHLSEIQAGAIKHALRFTSCAGCIGSPALWPATGSTASAPGAAPMGSRWRLKSTFDLSTFSPKAQIVLKALQTYGMILADIGGIGQIQFAQDVNLDPAMQSALGEIQNAKIVQSNFDIVDESSLMVAATSSQAVSAVPGPVLHGRDASGNRITVPVAIQPVLIGVPNLVIYPQAGTAYTLPSWVNGAANQAVNWSLASGPGAMAGAVYSAPAAVTAPTPFTLTGSAAADGANPVTVSGFVLPAGAIRLDVGAPTPYTDADSNVWMADNIGVLTASYSNNNNTYPGSSWSTVPDYFIYGWNKSTWGDDIQYGPFLVPNGNYNVVFGFAKGDCPSPGTYDSTFAFDNGLVSGGPVGLEVNGAMTMFDVGGSIKNACFTPTVQTIPVTVTNNMMRVAVRATGGANTHQAPFLNTLQILPALAAAVR